MKLSSNKYYLFFSLIGWILLFFSTLAFRKMVGEDISSERFKYLLAESLSCGVLAYLTTFIVSIYIDLKIDFNKISCIDICKISILFVFIQLIYSLLIWPLLDVVDLWDGSLSSVIERNFLTVLFNAIYFGTLYFIWFFVFFTIKMYYHLKVVKMKQFQLESSLKESQLNILKGQLNPHFMFNSLNNIRGLMLEDVDKSRNMLTNLSETLRYSLTKSDVDSIALEDELDMVDSYVAISKIQFEDRLQFEKNIAFDTLNKEIPPMIIQMLVENAIKHGISNLKTGGVLRISSKIIEAILEIEVSNPGELKETKSETLLGVKNIEKRLELLYNNKATFSLKNIENRVVATIKIPI